MLHRSSGPMGEAFLWPLEGKGVKELGPEAGDQRAATGLVAHKTAVNKHQQGASSVLGPS